MLFWILITLMRSQVVFSYEISICTTLICPDLSEYHITCNSFENNIDCLQSINENETQLGYAPSFESVIVTQVLPNLELVGDVRAEANSSQWLYEVVVLTNKPVSNFVDLKNVSYCLQEFGAIPKFVILGLERAILKSYKSLDCRSKSSFAEEHVCNLNEFFGPSCRARTFKYNTIETDYTKLFQLCPDDNCTTKNVCTLGYPEDGCLQHRHGALTITTLFNATTMWNPNLYYLCQNGSTSTKPCVWYRQPWPLIFTHKSMKQSIRPKLNALLSICAVPGEQKCLNTLGEILTATNDPQISIFNENEVDGIIPAVQPYNLDSRNSEAIKWCTLSDIEYKKCNRLKEFSGTIIYPIDCILRDSIMSCISSIENYEADIVEIVKLPISDLLSPIAFSTTPVILLKNKFVHLLSGRDIPKTCTDKYNYVNSSMFMKVMPNSSYICCPDGRYQLLCTNEVCHYHKEVIMRINDPNRENAKLLLDDLSYAKISKTHSFDFGGDFIDVSNWLLQSSTTDFYYILYNQKDFEVEEDDISYSARRGGGGIYILIRLFQFLATKETAGVFGFLSVAAIVLYCIYKYKADSSSDEVNTAIPEEAE